MADRVRIPDLLDARSRGDLAVEDRFFSNLQLRTGVYKLTYRHRFDDTLAATLAHAHRIGAHRVLDLACSSGVSTVELSCVIGPGVYDPEVVARILAEARTLGLIVPE